MGKEPIYFPEERDAAENLRRELPKDADTARELLQSTVRAAMCAAPVRERLSGGITQCTEILGLIAASVRKFNGELPAQTSVFGGQESETRFFPAFHTMMRELESGTRALEHEMLAFSAVESLAAAHVSEGLHAERLCHAVADAVPGLREAAGQALAGLASDRDQTERLLANGRKCREALEFFCRHGMADFSSRAAENADVEHNGTGARPSALSRLCGEFSHITERLSAQIAELFPRSACS